MSKRKQVRKAYGKSAHYWPKDMQPFLMTATNITIEQTSGCLIVLYYNNSSGKESIRILPQHELQTV